MISVTLFCRHHGSKKETVDVGLQTGRTSNTSNVELEQQVVTHSATPCGLSNDSPLSDHELSEGKLLLIES